MLDSLTDSIPDKERIWYAIQTFHCKEEQLGKYLAESKLNYFIPMRYGERVTSDGKRKRILVPAIHNLLFVEKTVEDKKLLSIASESPVPFLLIRHRETRKICEIRDREMIELRAICDPNYEGTLFVDVSLAETRPGSRVRVINGPFKGLEGKLSRYKGRSYVVVMVASLGVMVHIPRWYCEKII